MTEPLLGAEIGRGTAGTLLKPGQKRLQRRDVEVLLRAEVLEDEAVRDAGLRRDVIDRDVFVVAVQELLERDLEKLLAPSPGSVGCQRAPSQGAPSLVLSSPALRAHPGSGAASAV